MIYAFGAGEVPISISGDPPASGPLRAHGAGRSGRSRGRSALPAGRQSSACAGPSAAPGRWTRRREGTWSSSPAASAWRRFARRCSPRSRAPSASGAVLLLYGGREPEQLLYREELGGWAATRRSALQPHGGQRRRRAWAGEVGVVTKLDRAAPIRPDADGGDGLRAGGDDALRRAGAAERAGSRRRRIHISMERNMKCAITHCGRCQFGPTFVCREGPGVALRRRSRRSSTSGSCDGRARPSRSWRSGSSPPATAASSACSSCEDELLALAERDRHRLLPRGEAGDRRGPLRHLAGRGLDHHGARRRADPRGPGRVSAPGDHDRGLRDRRRDPGAAQLRRHRGVRRRRLRHPVLHLDAGRPRPRSATTCRSTSSFRAARSTSSSCWRC